MMDSEKFTDFQPAVNNKYTIQIFNIRLDIGESQQVQPVFNICGDSLGQHAQNVAHGRKRCLWGEACPQNVTTSIALLNNHVQELKVLQHVGCHFALVKGPERPG